VLMRLIFAVFLSVICPTGNKPCAVFSYMLYLPCIYRVGQKNRTIFEHW